MVTAEPLGTALVILEPNGRLTAETVHEFNRIVSKWLRRGWHDVILDLRFVDYLDSAGLGALAHAYLSSRQRGGRIAFVNVGSRNRELLRITKLLTVFEVYDSMSAAERSFAAAATREPRAGSEPPHLAREPHLGRGPFALDRGR